MLKQTDVHTSFLQPLQQHRIAATDPFYQRLMAGAVDMQTLYNELYSHHPVAEKTFTEILQTIITTHLARPSAMQQKDAEKIQQQHWFLSNEITGMSLYVDRFCGNLKNLAQKLDYFTRLGVNLLHLMPIFESPENESDGGYAIANFRKVSNRFGTLDDLKAVRQAMDKTNQYLMLDIVLNHTSHRHEWAEQAKGGNQQYQDYYYMFANRQLPDAYEAAMPEVFPGGAPGNFTWVPECSKWVMTVFHGYQWDLNFSNPVVFREMLDNILFYANLGVDILRIDAPAFIWKQLGTTCQNLPLAHTLLRLIKLCVQVAAPGMALLGEAIVSPEEIIKYFGAGNFIARECDFAYNATHMALQWDALATGNTRVMLAAQHLILQKPFGTSWITYTRCHDDIGLAYNDDMIRQAGFEPLQHRQFLKDFYSGAKDYSMAMGALFAFNPKTGDARISGTLASLCGLEKAITQKNNIAIDTAIDKILLMQAVSFFMGGLPMLFYGDELGYTNDYAYLEEPGKSYDNRWMHRPEINWHKALKADEKGTIENRIFTGTQQLIALRKKLTIVADYSNLTWLTPHNIHVAGYLRRYENKKLYCLFNFSSEEAFVTWYIFKEHGVAGATLYDHWKEKTHNIGRDEEYLVLPPYGFYIMEAQ